MPTLPIENVGAIGIISDVPAHSLPPEAWSSGRNVRMRSGLVEKFQGEEEVFASPQTAPYALFTIPLANQYLVMYAGINSVFATDGTVHADITRLSGAYSASAGVGWNGGVIGGIPVINNGNDVPQMWSPPGLGQKLQDLTNWPTSPATTARVLRVFRSFLVGLDFNEGGTRNERIVRWSHPADPGAVPVSWDYANPAVLAGRIELAETPDFIIDGVPFGDFFVIYKQMSTYVMQFIGGNFVFRFTPVSRRHGILARECAKEVIVNGSRYHFVATTGDIMLFNGTSHQSIVDRKRRKAIFTGIDPINFDRSFVVLNVAKNEVWFCYPEIGAEFATRAAVWNSVDGSWGDRDIPLARFGVPGLVNEGVSQVWDDDLQFWDLDDTVWDSREFNPTQEDLLMAIPSATPKILRADRGNTYDAGVFTSYIERTGLSIVGRDRAGNPKVDPNRNKFVRAIYPKFEGVTPGKTINVRAGFQNNPTDPVTWAPAVVFDPQTMQKATFFNVNGPYIAVRFESTDDMAWKLSGYVLDLELAGAN